MATKPERWIEAHRDYPHEDWCLIWPFARESRVGRGIAAQTGGGNTWAHRLMCELIHGQAPADKPQCAHSCGNGHEGCVNPRHLSWASNSENQLLRYAQGRGNPNANGSVGMFTDEQIAEMRSLYGQMTQLEIAARFGCSLGAVQYYLKYRAERGHDGGKIDHWKPHQEEALREGVARGCYMPELQQITGRSKGAISSYAYRHKLNIPRRPYGYTVSASNGECK